MAVTSAIPTIAFRECVGEFATGVTVVTAEVDGEPAGMTLNSFTSVSLDPLLVLVSLGHGSRTLAAIARSGRFVVSILSRRQQLVAVDFAERGAPFPAQHVRRTGGGLVAVAEAAAVLGCLQTALTADLIPSQDQNIVVGSLLVASVIVPNGGELYRRGRARLRSVRARRHAAAAAQAEAQ